MFDCNKKLVFVTEINLIEILFLTLISRKISVIGTYSYIFCHGSYIEKIIIFLHKKGLVEVKEDRMNEIPYKDSGDFQRLNNYFQESEKWMEDKFKFRSIKGSYEIPIKHIICNRSSALYQRCHDYFHLSNDHTRVRLSDFESSYYNHRFNQMVQRSSLSIIKNLIVNFLLLISSLAFSCIWILSKIKVRVKGKHITLAVDYNGGSRDMKFWNFLNDERAKTLVVVRDKYTLKTFGHLLKGYNVVSSFSGSLDVKSGFSSLIVSLMDGAILFWNYCFYPPDCFRQICMLPIKKIKYKALFSKYKCDFFWGRDDYDPQHAIRAQELRKIGGVSMGFNHGIQSICAISFQLRYIDFDYYYMHGLGVYNEFYRKTWPNYLIAKDIGSPLINPRQRENILSNDGQDILVLVAPSFHQKKIFEAVEILIQHFTDLKFHIATKEKHENEGLFGKLYQKLLNTNYENVFENKKDVYDTLAHCKYVFSESSTLLAEGVHFNKVVLCYDPDPTFKYLYYRKFPEIIFKDINQITKRISETREDKTPYRDPKLADLIYLGDQMSWQFIKKDMIFEIKSKNSRTEK